MGVTQSGQSKRVKVTPMAFCKMIALLQRVPSTYADIVEYTGLNDRTVRQWVAELKRQHLVYIASWECNGGNSKRPEWGWQTGSVLKRDVPLPKMTPQERNRKYRSTRAKKEYHLDVMHRLAGPAQSTHA